jgi:integrase
VASNPRKLGSGRWQVEWRVTGGQGSPRRSQTFTTKTEARAFKAQVETDLHRGQHVDPRQGRVSVRVYSDLWLTSTRRAPGTVDAYRYHLARILPLIGDRQIGQVRAIHLREVLTHLERRGLAQSTVATAWGVLSSMFRAAVRDQVIPVSPCEGITVSPPARAEVKVLTADQLGGLLDAAGWRKGRDVPLVADRVMLLTAVGTGLRQGELFGLRAPRVELLRRVLSVEEQVTTGKGRPPALTSTLKTATSRRRVPLPDELIDVLSAYLPGRDVLFTTPRSGGLWQRSHFNATVWKPALLRAGLDTSLGLHVLRHTYASHLIAAGRQPKTIQRLMGHSSIVETMDTYGHLFPDDDDQTRTALSGLLQLVLRSDDRTSLGTGDRSG